MKNISISSDEEDDEQEDERETEQSVAETIEATAEDEEHNVNFGANLIEARKLLDEIPSLVAKLNTELDMLAKNRIVVRSLPSNDDGLDAFIWKFNITIEWGNQKYPLPIQQAEDIEKLNDALNDESIYHYVVSFDAHVINMMFSNFNSAVIHSI